VILIDTHVLLWLDLPGWRDALAAEALQVQPAGA